MLLWRTVQFAEHQHCIVFLPEDTDYRGFSEQAADSLILAQLWDLSFLHPWRYQVM